MKNKNRSIPTLASIFAFTALLSFTNSFADTTTPSLNQQLANVAAELNKQLPITKPDITLHNMEVIDNQLIISATFSQVAAKEANESIIKKEETITQDTRDNMCNSEVYRQLLNNGATIVYNYYGNDNKQAYQTTTTQKDCLPETEATAVTDTDTSIQTALQEQAKEINDVIQAQGESQTLSRKVIVESNTYIDKLTFKKMTAQQVSQLIQKEKGKLPVNNKNTYCSLKSIQALLDKEATFSFEYYGNDSKLAFKATLDKSWCAYNDEEKLTAQKLENESQSTL